MKKIIILFFSCLLMICLSSCGHQHTYGEWTIATRATCTTEGLRIRTCECGQVDAKTVARTSHVPSNWTIDKKPTCSETGSKHQTCSVCKETIQTEVLDKLAHKTGKWVTTVAATCTENGIKHQLCEVCDEVLDESIIPKGHKTGDWVTAKEATCTENGIKHQVCSVCEEPLRSEAITKKGHTYGTWIIDKEATCTEDGAKHLLCSTCNETIKNATIKSPGHTYGAWIVDKSATCTEEGTKHQICSVCKENVGTGTIPATGHTSTTSYTAPTCQTNGNTTATCTKCSSIVYTKDWEPVTISVSITGVDGIGKYTVSKLYVRGGKIIYENGVEKQPEYTIRLTNYTDQKIIQLNHVAPSDGSEDYYMAVSNSNYYYSARESSYGITINDGMYLYAYVFDYYNQTPTLSSGPNMHSWDYKNKVVLQEATCKFDGIYEVPCDCGEKFTYFFSTDHEKTLQNAAEINDNFYAIMYCSICDVTVQERFDPISLSLEWKGVSFGDNNCIVKYKLNPSGGIGNYSYNIVVAENFGSGDYTTVAAWSQTSDTINHVITYSDLNRLNPILIIIWVGDDAGLTAYKFYFNNYTSTGSTTQIYIPYELN